MTVYGFGKNSDESSPEELAEITLMASPGELRKVAAFLLWAAGQIEAHGAAFGHEHIIDFYKDWSSPADLVVVGSQ